MSFQMAFHEAGTYLGVSILDQLYSKNGSLLRLGLASFNHALRSALSHLFTFLVLLSTCSSKQIAVSLSQQFLAQYHSGKRHPSASILTCSKRGNPEVKMNKCCPHGEVGIQSAEKRKAL
ncbi:hypothetical protein BT96DRAFT_654487 [Gymnopus androsaceus JB14]|uniref:Uncharacterized protein n=1 Tax=Gymnopus androsaceus JB14 TaxID=1447944 RepID=A0A6A4HT61_9AGAR|nr:hypothetical protein BT96DRAFT_654487 [Gymnopus androsaceus JB14]